MKQKVFGPILVIFIILVAIGGIYYFRAKKEGVSVIPAKTLAPTTTNPPTQFSPSTKPTTEQTANWKTYLNSQYGYQIKIPQTWSVKEEYSPADSQIKSGTKIQMVTLSDPKTSIKIFYEGDWDHGFEPWIVVLNEKTSLGGRSAQLVVFKQNKNDNPSDGWAVYSNTSNMPNFRIETTYTKEVEQILSTFKFAQ